VLLGWRQQIFFFLAKFQGNKLFTVWQKQQQQEKLICIFNANCHGAETKTFKALQNWP
jgi:hypothetical protein